MLLYKCDHLWLRIQPEKKKLSLKSYNNQDKFSYQVNEQLNMKYQCCQKY